MNPAYFANPQLFGAYQQDPRLGYAQALMGQGASTAPVRSPLEGFARALTAGVGGLQAGQVRRGYQEQDDKYRKGLATALQGGDVLQSLQDSGDPYLQQMGLEARMRQELNPADDPLVEVVQDGIKIRVPSSQAAGMQADYTPVPKAPDMRTIGDGRGGLLDQQWNPQTGTYETVGSRPKEGPAPPAPPEVIRLLQAAGIDPKSPQGQAAINHALGTEAKAQYGGIVTGEAAKALNLDPAKTWQQGPDGKWNAVDKPEDPKVPQLTTMVAPDGSSETLDKTTPEGIAKLRDLLTKGYTERSGADPNSKPFTEDQSKAAQLLTEIVPEVQIVTDNFKALESTVNQLAAMGPDAASNLFTTPEYQRARQAIAHIIANNLYSLSGAQITPQEADLRAAILMPTIGESAASIADKKARIQQLVDGMKARAGRAADNIQFPVSVPPASQNRSGGGPAGRTAPPPPPPPGFIVVPPQ